MLNYKKGLEGFDNDEELYRNVLEICYTSSLSTQLLTLNQAVHNQDWKDVCSQASNMIQNCEFLY